ncbi:hypothetical protein F0562_014631 [Nyssa sinensis]|uniref:Uncharacterized protein n=1 Tax=Nyssa sinensis TaxID=561372 RepID=A0A5J4ZNY5_9ASTE|nr:hypothetical protein F0562_014631 [Nyssa sinensis]
MAGVNNLQSVPVPDVMEPQPAAPVPDVIEPQPADQDSLFTRALKKVMGALGKALGSGILAASSPSPLVPYGSRDHSGAYRFTGSPEAVKIFGCKCDLCTGIDL